jgi:hypothetical protein
MLFNQRIIVPLIALELGCSFARPATDVKHQLFTPSRQSYRNIDEAMRSRILRYRFVVVDLNILKETQAALKRSRHSRSILTLNLFEDAVFPVALDRAEVRSSESFSYFGRVDGVENSTVTLVAENGVMAGDIRVHEAYYQVRYAGEGTHVVYQVNPNAFPREANPLIPNGRIK